MAGMRWDRGLLALSLAAGACLAGGASHAAPEPQVGRGAPAAGFAQATAPRRFTFPQDHGAHREFRQEWWYFTGNLAATDGERFGFELTFFRIALVAPAQGPAPGADRAISSAWRAREIYMAHFAVTDLARRTFHATQKLSREALGLAGADLEDLHVWIDDWWAKPNGSGWQLHASQPGYALTLEALPLMAPVLNGEAGLSRKSDQPGSASYYYSVPRIAVQGQLLRDGVPRAVRGTAWLDREWGSGALGTRASGWDWFALQLDDGSTLMFYALRDSDGTRDRNSAGTWVDPQGHARPIANEEMAIAARGSWTSPRGGRYPSGWRLQVPSLQLDLEVRPVIAAQELDTTPRYWEGAVDAKGAREGRPLQGRGYVELVGYARDSRTAAQRAP